AGTLGGVARRTREAMLLCEAGGFDVGMVETVGVGQSEVAVAGMVDLFLLVIAPGAGDELQGIQRGVIERADVVVVKNNEGELARAAKTAATDYSSALRLVRSKTTAWTPRVVLVSALDGTGIDELWSTVEEFRSALGVGGDLEGRRAEQAREWMWSEVSESLMDALRHDEPVAGLVGRLEAAVTAGELPPAAAAAQILAAFRGSDRWRGGDKSLPLCASSLPRRLPAFAVAGGPRCPPRSRSSPGRTRCSTPWATTRVRSTSRRSGSRPSAPRRSCCSVTSRPSSTSRRQASTSPWRTRRRRSAAAHGAATAPPSCRPC